MLKKCVLRAVDILEASLPLDVAISNEIAWMFFPVPKYHRWRQWWIDPMTMDKIILYEEDSTND